METSPRRPPPSALSASDPRLHVVIEQMNEGVIVGDFEGNLLHWNRAAFTMHGFSSLEEVQRKLSDFIELFELATLNDEKVPFEQWPMARLLRREPVQELELRVRRLDRPDWEQVFRYSGAFADAPDQTPLVFLTVTNVTERVRAAQRLATQNAVSRVLADAPSLSEATPKLMQALCETEGWDLGVVWEVDRARGVLRCAEMWHRPDVAEPELVELTRTLKLAQGEGLPGRVWAEGKSMFIDDVALDTGYARAPAAVKAGLRRALAFPITLRDEVTGVIDFLGRRALVVDAALIEMFGAIGSQLGLFFERKRADAERATLEEQLRESQKMEAIGQLSGGIAHDLNNALAAILGNAHLALLDIEEGSPPAECVREIEKASERARDLVQQILTFARRRPTERKVVVLRSVIEETLKLLRAALPAGVALTFTCSDETLRVIGDATQIHQVLLNLGTNAWQAMQDKPGRIDVGLSCVTLDETRDRALANMRPGRYARVSVRDNGAGMSPQTLARMFEPFFTTKPLGQGTGLGLSVVHGIMEEHGGAVRASSVLGHGTTFDVYFPVALPAMPRDLMVDGSVRPLKPAATSAGQRLLVIDDEEALVLLAKRYLGRVGYDVTGFVDAQEAIAAFRAEPGRFDAVITDMNMPVLSGLQVAEAILALSKTTPVLLCSGYVTEELRAAALRLGIRAVVHKPTSIEDLAEALHSILGSTQPA